ncbi:hypothetical protein QE152_g7884 [Popillia japonica]|uniref:Uncharacterized protein n=1 Tax=Popillia japonica TaxID=7064 RepID=A0AAW1M775_POPJA
MPKRHYKALMHLSKQQKNQTISDYIMASTSSSVTEPMRDMTQVESGVNSTNDDVTASSYLINETYIMENELNNVVAISVNISSNDSNSTSSVDSLSMKPENSQHDVPYMTDEETPVTFAKKLAAWAKQTYIPLSRLNELLGLLREHTCFNSLPKDSRALLHTPRTYQNAMLSLAITIILELKIVYVKFF